VVVGLYQPLADDGTLALFVRGGRPTMPCLLQSLQKAKRRGLRPVRSSSPSRRLGLLRYIQRLKINGLRLSTAYGYDVAVRRCGQSPAGFIPVRWCGAREAKPCGLHTPGARRALPPSRHTRHPADSEVLYPPARRSHCRAVGGASRRAPGVRSPPARAACGPAYRRHV